MEDEPINLSSKGLASLMPSIPTGNIQSQGNITSVLSNNSIASKAGKSLFGNPMMVAGMIGIAGSAALGIYGVVTANKQRRQAIADQEFAQNRLDSLIDNRQEIVNPYDEIQDLSGMLSNPMANLGVATQAAEMQIEQADISLANTLDTLRATGASAGGATALAQAALQSKKGVSASIEQQEVQNERLRAQGEQALQQRQMSEAQRVQQARAQGEAFVVGQQERRELADIDRVAGQLENAQARQAQADADRMAAIGASIGGITGTIGSMAQSGAFNTALTNPNDAISAFMKK